MAQNQTFRFGPVALTTTTTTNIMNCAVSSLAGPVGFSLTQPYVILRKITVGNKGTSTAFAGLWIGATGANAAGTEVPGFCGAASAGSLTASTGRSIPPNSAVTESYALHLDSADFLVGGASAATTLTISGEGEIGFSAPVN